MADNKENYNLYTEKIKEKPAVKYKKVIHLLKLAALAVFMGAVAGMTFVTVVNFSGSLEQNEDDVRHEVTIPMDEYPGSDEYQTSNETVEVQTELVNVNGEKETVSSNLPDNTVENNQQDNKGEMSEVYVFVSEKLVEIQPSLVSITAIDQNEDLLFSAVQEELDLPGVIIADNDVEYLVLTDYEINDVDSIEVAFFTGEKSEAVLVAADKTSDMAIIAVPHKNVTKSTRDSVKIIELGNSYMLKQGELVLAAGNMFGASSSVNLGMAVNTKEVIYEADSRHGLIYTNMSGAENCSGFLFNEAGQLIGNICRKNSEDNIIAYGISDIKIRIQNMTNLKKIGYLGIIGQEITEEMAAEYGLIKGVYVSSTEFNSPAYFAGITNGDIITSINGREIFNTYNMERAMCEFEPGTEVVVIVNRKGRNGYVPLEFTITLSEK